MATTLAFLQSLDTALAGLAPALSVFAARSDHRTDLDDLQAGESYVRIRHQNEQHMRDSNQTIEAVSVELEVSHYLTDRYDERAYTRGDMLSHHTALMDPEFWRDITEVRELASPPVMSEDVNREGNVVSYVITTTVAIKP